MYTFLSFYFNKKWFKFIFSKETKKRCQLEPRYNRLFLIICQMGCLHNPILKKLAVRAKWLPCEVNPSLTYYVSWYILHSKNKTLVCKISQSNDFKFKHIVMPNSLKKKVECFEFWISSKFEGDWYEFSKIECKSSYCR